MDEPNDPSLGKASVITNRGILIIMAVLITVGSIAGFAIGGPRWGVGVFFGGGLSFLNYLWLDRSTKAIFATDAIATTGVLAMKYILRYVVIGLVVYAIWYTGVLPVTAVVAGLATFAVAVVIRGIQNIFTSSI